MHQALQFLWSDAALWVGRGSIVTTTVVLIWAAAAVRAERRTGPDQIDPNDLDRIARDTARR